MRPFRRFLILAVITMSVATLLPVQAQGTDPTTYDTLVSRFMNDFYNQRQLDKIEEFYTKDFVRHEPGSKLTLDEWKKSLKSTWDYCSETKLTLLAAVGEGDLVGSAYLWTATCGGKKVQLNGIALARNQSGKMAEEWAMWDSFYSGQLFGAIPVQGELPVFQPWVVKRGESKMTAKDMKALVERSWKVWPHTIMVDAASADYAVHLPQTQPPAAPGFAGYAVWTKTLHDLFPDLALKGPAGKSDYVMLATGDLLLVQYEIVFKFTRDFPGNPPIPANGAAITVPGISLLRFKDGLPVEFWVNWDTASMMQQMMAPKA